VRRKDLLWLAGPAIAADSGAALLDSNEAAICAAAAFNSAPFIRISTSRTDHERCRCSGHDNYAKNFARNHRTGTPIGPITIDQYRLRFGRDILSTRAKRISSMALRGVPMRIALPTHIHFGKHLEKGRYERSANSVHYSCDAPKVIVFPLNDRESRPILTIAIR
jgi:hypothetical protein